MNSAFPSAAAKIITAASALLMSTYIVMKIRAPHKTAGISEFDEPAATSKQLDKSAQSRTSQFAGNYAGKGAYNEPAVAGVNAKSASTQAERDFEEDLILGILAGGT